MEVFKKNLLLCLVLTLTIKSVVSRHVSSNKGEEKEDPNNMKVPVRYSSILNFEQPRVLGRTIDEMSFKSIKSCIGLMQLGATHSNI